MKNDSNPWTVMAARRPVWTAEDETRLAAKRAAEQAANAKWEQANPAPVEADDSEDESEE